MYGIDTLLPTLYYVFIVESSFLSMKMHTHFSKKNLTLEMLWLLYTLNWALNIDINVWTKGKSRKQKFILTGLAKKNPVFYVVWKAVNDTMMFNVILRCLHVYYYYSPSHTTATDLKMLSRLPTT